MTLRIYQKNLNLKFLFSNILLIFYRECRVMANVKKCPLCGGDVINNYCFSCGIDLPDEENLISKTDPEPIRNNRPVMTAEPENYPNIKVTGEQHNHTANPGFNTHERYNENAQSGNNTNSNNQSYYNTNNGYENNGFNQYRSDSRRPTAFSAWAENYAKLSMGEKFKRYWWYILLIVLIPGGWAVAGLAAIVTAVSQTGKGVKRFVADQILLALIAIFILF
jgi:hypothetical protein